MSLTSIATPNYCQVLALFLAAVLLTLPLPTAAQSSAAANSSTTGISAQIKNPFTFNVTDNDQGLIPIGTGRLPQSMRLATVLILDNGDALAALRLPGETAPVFVRVNDLISVDFPHQGTANKDSALAATTAPEQAPVYLLIKSISATGVEVAPRVRPTEVHLIR